MGDAMPKIAVTTPSYKVRAHVLDVIARSGYTPNIFARGLGLNTMHTIGLLCAMIENQLLSVDDAFKALDRMKSGKRRLPWPEAEKVLNALS